MSTQLRLPYDAIEGIIGRAEQASAVDILCPPTLTNSRRNQIVLSVGDIEGKYHTDTAVPKQVQDVTTAAVPVPMRTLYTILKFQDFEADDAPGIVDQIEGRLPGALARTHDKATFGASLVATSPFSGFTNAEVEVDDTADSWIAAIEKVSDAGFTPSGIILDNSLKSLLAKASSTVNTNPLSIRMDDGFLAAGVPVYFRNLGAPVGVVGDWSMACNAYFNNIEFELHRPEDDFSLRLENAVALYAGWRRGFAVGDQNAFQKITVAA